MAMSGGAGAGALLRYIGAMRDLRPAILSALLIFSGLLFSSLLPGCATQEPAQPQSPPPEATPQPGPSNPAGATPTLHAPSPATDEKPVETVDIRGRVTQARRNGQGELPVGTLQVEGSLEPGTRYAKATIHVGHKTKIFLGRSGPDRKQASFSFIHSGDLVEVTFVGPPAETTGSDPVKATAATIVILEHTP
jgi:hypothetical protein